MKRSESRPLIVILGDWYIDENWLVSRQELYHSSATGDIHFLARHKNAPEQVTNLCATATIVVALQAYFQKFENLSPDFLAFGAWNPEDDDLIRRVLCPISGEKLLSAYTLSSSPNSSEICKSCKDENRECMYKKQIINLATSDDKSSVSTNRVIRCYEGHRGGTPRQLYRFDWMLPLKLHSKRYERIGNQIKNREVVGIIIVDHGAGVVNEKSIQPLIDKTQRAGKKKPYWFLRTKIDNPIWIKKLIDKKIDVEMNVSDQRLAAHLKGNRLWRQGQRLGRSALELLGEMAGVATYQGREKVLPTYTKRKKVLRRMIFSQSAIVLLDDNTVFALAREGREKNGERCILISQAPGLPQVIHFGRTTIFTAALFAQRLKALLKGDGEVHTSSRLASESCVALQCSYDWSKRASDKWEKEQLSLYDLPKESLKKIEIYQEIIGDLKQKRWDEFGYMEEWRIWNESSRGSGIVKKHGGNAKTKESLELWRGEGVLKDYICVGGPKRDAINNLVSAVAKFLESKNPSLSFSCLLQSPPGWGKSFLAKCLATHFDMEFLEFSIAQMSDNRDLMDCFATIASTQTKTDKRTLVFIDEINAEIEGHNVMGLLLSPLWGGTFVKDRQAFRLKPGVWVFASTASAAELRKDQKGSDFLSRLSGPIIELDSPTNWTRAINKIQEKLHGKSNIEFDTYRKLIYKIKEYKSFLKSEKDHLKTEQVYLIVSLLNKRWGPISRVNKRVLNLFRNLLPINGFRSLELFASSFEGIKRGEVDASNVPQFRNSVELRRHVIVPSWWYGKRSRKDDEEFVDIETRIK